MPRNALHGLLALIIALVNTIAACHPSTVPQDPGLLAEDFGIGIRLDQTAEEASQAAAQAPAGIKALCITPEELNQQAPYTDRPEGLDLVYALHAPLQFQPGQTTADRIFEIRCYLGPEAKSSLTLLGHKLASLDPEGMKALLGQPISVGKGGDGHTHLTYIYRIKGASAPAIEVTSSHWLGGQCFAFQIKLTESPE